MRLLAYDAYRIALLLYRATRWLVPVSIRYLVAPEVNAAAFGVRLRGLFTAMGGAYVKLGQFLAIRLDLLSPAICNELSRLMDAVPPEDFAAVRKRVEAELGGPLEAFFRAFSPVPLAAASIAQVHRAVARDGAELAVKVQRATVARELAADLRNLRRLARVAALLVGDGSLAMQLVEEFRQFTLREIDFLREAATAARLHRESPAFVRIPRVRWDLTTTRVLSMDFIDGVSLLKVCQLAEAGHPNAFAELVPGTSAETLVHRLAWACLNQQFVTGRFHGDPHPANVMIDREGRVVFVDFGIFGELPSAEREALGGYALNVARGRLRAAFNCLATLVSYGPDTDVIGFRGDAIALLRRWRTSVAPDRRAPAAERLVARFQFEMLDIMRRHGVRMKRNQVLFWRAQAMLDATAYRLPVRFDLLSTVSEFLSRNTERVFAGAGGRRAARSADEVVALIAASPQVPGRIADAVARGPLVVRMQSMASARSARQAKVRTTALVLALTGVSVLIVARALAL
jgi:ubiquinone biosynthesis protein